MKKNIFLTCLIVLILCSISMAYTWPTVSKRVTDWYGSPRSYGGHGGIDIGAVKPGVDGDKVYAVGPGKVSVSGWSNSVGNWIAIQLNSGYTVEYRHLSKRYVNVGNVVTEGQVIGLMGNTGSTSRGTHLDFKVKKTGKSGWININQAVKNYINKGIKVPTPGSASSNVAVQNNMCNVSGCNAKKGTTWKDDGKGNHYKACANGHKKEEGAHSDKDDLKCDVCKLEITTCYKCKAKLKAGWQTNTKRHYKVCANGHESYLFDHTYNKNDVCTKCGYIDKMQVKVSESNGNLVMTMSHNDFKVDTVRAVAINWTGENLFWKEGIVETAKTENAKIMEKDGNELKVEDGKITLTIKPKTFLANRLAKEKHELEILVNNNTEKIYKVTQIVEGIFTVQEDMQVKVSESNGNLVMTMSHSDFKVDTVRAVAINWTGENLFWKEGIVETAKTENVKIMEKDGNELKIEDGKIILTIKPKTILANRLAKEKHELEILVNNNTEKIYKVTQIVEGIFTVQEDMQVKVSESNGNLVMTMSHSDFKVDTVRAVAINWTGENLFWKEGIVETAKTENAKIMEKDGNELKVEDGKITLTIKSGTFLANRLAKEKNELEILVNNNTEKIYKVTQIVEGIFTVQEDMKVEVSESNGNLVMTMSHSDFKVDTVRAVAIDLENENLLWINNLTTLIKEGNAKKINISGNELRIEEGKLTLVMKEGTDLLNRLLSNKENINIEVDNTNKIMSILTSIETNNYKCTICKTDAKAKWIVKETMHVLLCEKDSSHVMQIESHEFDKNNICVICKYKNQKEYQVAFVDFVEKNHWAWNNVGHMVELGIVQGDERNGQRYLVPNESITAEAFIVLLARTLGYEKIEAQSLDMAIPYIPAENINSAEELKFLLDCLEKNGKDPKAEMMVLLSKNGINGTEEELKDNYVKAISRERVAHLLAAFIQSNPRQEIVADSFEDWEMVNDAYRERIKILSAYDIFRGKSNNGKLYVKPTESITRVEAIALMDRFNTIRKLGITYAQ